MTNFLNIEIDDETNEYHIEGKLGYDEVVYAKSFQETLENATKSYSEYTEEYQKTLGYKDGLNKAEELYSLYQKIHSNKTNSDTFVIKINELIKQSDENLKQWENTDEPYNDIDDGQEHHNEMGFNAGLNYGLKIYKEIILSNQEQVKNTKNYVTKLEKIIISTQQENEKLQKILVKNGINLEAELSR